MAKVNELLKLLKKDGWFLHRHGSKHDLYRHPIINEEIAIPRHSSKELAIGTYQSILKKAGIK